MTAALNSSVMQIRKVKRVVDITISLLGLIPGLPLILLSGLMIKLSSPGPVIYRQQRVGLGGQPYFLYKLRSMRTDAEAQGAVWARKQDARVTRVGYFLRKWRIDELPQLFNILKGEMSLVGPRPERPEFTEKLATFIPFYNERHLVQPGLTGWAQVRYPYAASFEAAARKLQFDLYYIKNMSFLLDGAILLRTFKTILVGLRHEEDSFLPVEDKLGDLLETIDQPKDA
jgi:exopolysaccharide biosynthesis polyprenyl glycosylphosphotransferase